MSETTLRAGAGIGRIYLPMEYFITVLPDGSTVFDDGFNGTVHTFEGNRGTITDDPCIRVLLLESGIRTAIVSMEIAQAPADQIRYTRETVSELCGVEPAHIWVHSTHQFGFMHRPGDAKKAAIYDTAMKNAVEAAARQAAESFAPVSMRVGTGECRVSANKNILPPEGVEGGPYYGPGSTLETDPVMTAVRFEKENGSPAAFFLSYGTKPSALCTTGQKDGNRALNSEVTGVASKLVEERFGVPCVFCMPAAGDQYPRETAQYFGFDENGAWGKLDIGFEKGIEIVDRLGREMGNDAIAVCENTAPLEGGTEIRIAETSFAYPNKTGDGDIEVYVEAMTVGELAFAGFRQEMDCATGRQLQQASPYAVTLPVSFLNGDGKYFGHLEAYDFNKGIGTWETKRSPFAKGAAEKYVEVLTGVLNTLKAGGTVEKQSEHREKRVAAGETLDFAGMKWLVLERQPGRALLLAKNILFTAPYHNDSAEVVWADSSLRAYLNSEWSASAFTGSDAWRILPTDLVNAANPKYGIAGGALTRDRFFLLSLAEAEQYLSAAPELLTACDAEGSPTLWYLRSPGEAVDVAASVTAGGLIDYHGTASVAAAGGIRPAMWINTDSLQ